MYYTNTAKTRNSHFTCIPSRRRVSYAEEADVLLFIDEKFLCEAFRKVHVRNEMHAHLESNIQKWRDSVPDINVTHKENGAEPMPAAGAGGSDTLDEAADQTDSPKEKKQRKAMSERQRMKKLKRQSDDSPNKPKKRRSK